MRELLAAADLMARGWQVFRALSPAAPCDLMAIPPSGGPGLRFEVRTGYARQDGRVTWPRTARDQCDHYAVVTNSQVTYHPPLAGPETAVG